MSNEAPLARSTRGKAWVAWRTGEAVGRPLAEWAYRTSRFPEGIRSSDLRSASAPVQLETMLVWFLANHRPAEGPYFGFGEAAPKALVGALNTQPLNTSPPLGGVTIVGWGQGPWFSGGRAPELLKAEFGEFVPDQTISQAAATFDGLWEHIPPFPAIRFEQMTQAERNAEIVAAVDDFSERVSRLASPHGGIGHNGPPEDVPLIAEEERQIILRATADTKLAVLSSDYDAAKAAWETILPAVKKIGTYVGKLLDTYVTNLFGELGKKTATAVLWGGAVYVTGHMLLQNQFENITAMIELAKQLRH